MRRWWLAPLVVAPLFVAAPTSAQRARVLAGPSEAYVLIDGPPAATLELQDHDRWIRVCAAPCDRPFSIGKTYRIAGVDVRESTPFVLGGRPGSTVTLHFSESKHATGAALTEAGVIITLVGSLTPLGGVFGSCSDSAGSDECASYHWLTYTGGALAAVGVIAIVSGVVLMVQGADASVDQKVASLPPIEPFSARFRAEAEAPKQVLQPLPTTPIFSFSF